eukprot:CAMPEP_0114974600 /NCGR_PEP_ID=MMETSP0216-20121206/1616_1 /TAXON_ID=223996 /ORGANISM="Protocruzia adherens, Strain Boccale" /LENGTH=208 /DNA_ID=CAMNT_0002335253 /DNA_START=38 /DNA_END=661 /DNA_ORIENTATION=+
MNIEFTRLLDNFDRIRLLNSKPIDLTVWSEETMYDGIKDALREDGFVHLRNALPVNLVTKAEAIISNFLVERGAEDPSSKNMIQSKGTLLTGFRPVTHDPDVLSLVEGHDLRRIMTKVIGEETYTFDTKWIRVMGKDESTDIHTDFYRFQKIDGPIYICWIPLMNMDLQSGPLVLWKKSHLLRNYESLSENYEELPAAFDESVAESDW